MNQYTQNSEIQQIMAELNAYNRQQPGGKKIVSDIVDDAGNQYVDLVMEGGGTLGIALLGYIYVLEQQNIRFLRLAGTSAGSIVAMLLAGGGAIDTTKSDWLIQEVAGKDFYDFVDGGEDIRAFVDALLDKDKKKTLRNSRNAMEVLKKHFGLNPGLEFMRWMAELLRERGILTWSDMENQRKAVPKGLRNRHTSAPIGTERFKRISVVAADVTTQTKAVLPEMAHLYWPDPHTVNPADYVRASMSVPVFFYPLSADFVPTSEAAAQHWADDANYYGPIPPKVLFIDGGCMSNFPISLFHEGEKMPGAPVFGIKIGIDRHSYNSNESFGDFAGAVLGAMMAWADNDFFVQHPTYRNLIGVIDTGSYNWLDFSIPETGKIDLFVRGARAARDFLMRFDWGN